MKPFLSVVLILAVTVLPIPAADLQPTIEPKQRPYTFEASNGFTLKVAPHEDHSDIVGTSSWAETVTFHIKVPISSDDTMAVRLGEATLRTYYVDDTPIWDELETPEGIIGHPSLLEQQRVEALTHDMIVSDFESEPDWDLRVYEELAAFGLTEATALFWEDFRAAGQEFENSLSGVVPAGGCWWVCAECLVALAGYGFGLSSLIALCGATAGAGCIAALLGWQVAKAGIILACFTCLECLNQPETDEDERAPDGHHEPLKGL